MSVFLVDWSSTKLFNRIADSAIIQYRQVLNLPAFQVEQREQNEAKKRPERFRYLSWTPFFKELGFTSDSLKGNFRLFRDKDGNGDYVSLNVCTCYNVCPKWYTRVFSLGSWTRSNTSRNMFVISLMVILSLLPAGTISGLYAVPSTWGRLALIAGESGVVAAVLSTLEVLEDGDMLAYMIGWVDSSPLQAVDAMNLGINW